MIIIRHPTTYNSQMKNEIKRKQKDRPFQHVFKRTADKGVVFYRVEDHLVYFSIQSVMARRHNLPILASTHMFTHVHKMTAASDPSQLEAFEHDVNTVFTREYNTEYGRTGPLFAAPFGRATRRDDKLKRSSLIYVLNNPVEVRLAKRAIEDRWTFLAYYDNAFPFSERPVLNKCRWALRNAMQMVDYEFHGGRYLTYRILNQLFNDLNKVEKEQLTDYIICRYFFFDVERCRQLFGSLERMISAADLTTGKEFDVGEESDGYNDIPYREMCSLANKYKLIGPGMPLWHLPEERMAKLADFLRNESTASELEVARFLHRGLVLKKARQPAKAQPKFHAR